MIAPRIALLVDHPQRDLRGLVLTALELSRRGAVCHLVPANIAPREVWALAPDFLLLNYFRRSNEALARGALAANMGVGLLDTEGGVWSDVESYVELLWPDASLRHAARGVCVWGNAMAAELVARDVFTAGQVAVTGCPRFDVYHPAWRGLLTGGMAVQPGRPRVLVNTNFSTVNPRFTSVEQKVETSRRNFGWSDERVAGLLRTETLAIAAMIDLVARLARDFPGVDLVVRPHPFERPDPYEDGLRALPNVIVDNAGGVEAPICRSTAVIQRSCTTGIEAGFAGTPTLSPRWVPAPFEMPAAEAVSLPCERYEELRDALAAVVAGRWTAPPEVAAAIATVTHDWFHRRDGESYRRVADAVLRAVAGERRVNLAECDRLLYIDPEGTGLGMLARVGSHVRRGLRLPPDWSFRRLQRAPDERWPLTPKYFGAEDVRALAARIVDTARAAGNPLGGMTASVGLARERGEFRHGAYGHSVTLAAASTAERAA